jgi:hypothetical protein
MLRVLLLPLILASCATAPQAVAVRVHEPQYYFVGHTNPSQAQLQAAVDAALGGDDTQLRYVISLSRFADGESALNFGSLLLEVERTIGARRFERTLSTVPQETRELATAQMKAAKQMKELVERTRA